MIGRLPPQRPPRYLDSVSPDDVTTILDRAAAGDRQAAEALLPLVYDQLRSAAQQAMRDERAGHTLSATALVHEAYVRLVGPDPNVRFKGRAQFYAAASQAMRRYLIDHARAKLAKERGGDGRDGTRRASLTELREVADLAQSENPEPNRESVAKRSRTDVCWLLVFLLPAVLATSVTCELLCFYEPQL